jgi:HTH-type transcriptional regulator / antitoxin HigA
MSNIQDQYNPDYTVIPGETLEEVIETIGMSQAELALRTGRPKKTINGIIQGKVAITADTALQFERVLGIPANFWNNLQSQYQETVARMQEERRLQRQLDWLNDFPIAEMGRLGWIELIEQPMQQVKGILRFFGVATPDQWQAVWGSVDFAFRRSHAYQSKPKAVAAWLRRGEIEAQDVATLPYNLAGFRSALQEIRALTVEPPDVLQPKLVELCAKAGVAVVFVPELRGLHVSGVTRWLTPSKALIQLSLHYKTDDQLWFTFFHEAGHILLHGKRNVFLEEGNNEESSDAKEPEADSFAGDLLIPRDDLQQLVRQPDFVSKAAILRFARQLGIAPGIVIGRLQHDGHLPYSHCNDLKQHYVWAEMLHESD